MPSPPSRLSGPSPSRWRKRDAADSLRTCLAPFGISSRAAQLVSDAEASLGEVFSRMEAVARVNQYKVLAAFQAHNVGLRHFAGTTGYGYDDIGRDTLEKLYAQSLSCEDSWCAR